MIPELNRIYLGDCVETMRSWPDSCVDSVVTDPPYELGFMGKSWDSTGIAYSVAMWSEVLRVMKPGAHLLAFSATRTYHRMVCAIEDAGFEIRDQVQWLYGSGFPKSLDVSKAIDKAAGAERPVVGSGHRKLKGISMYSDGAGGGFKEDFSITGAATEAAKKWEGWGTALKPANEPIVLARKPLSEGTVAANVLKWGAGALNIDESRIQADSGYADKCASVVGLDSKGKGRVFGDYNATREDSAHESGRWPANVLFDQYASGVLDAQESGASRFFYVAKPDGGERNAGLEDRISGGEATGREYGSAGLRSPRAGAGRTGGNSNFHPTVKPVDLMAYLIRLVTPPAGIVLDPFMGSGTTGIAAARQSFPYLGCEMSAEYLALAEARIASETAQGKLL